MYFGVDYYPEHWSKERLVTDAQMMADANMNVVRMAEFAWSKMEPEEGVYEFSWLDEAIELLAEKGIQTILGTPSAAPPKWLMDKHPDFYPRDVFGMKRGFGGRRHYCYSNSAYREYARKITEEMAVHYSDNKQIIAWQIDNEMGNTCYCENCRTGFQQWLEEKYRTIDAVNDAWGTIFWSQTYRNFQEIPQPLYTACDGFSQNADSATQSMPAPYNHNPGLLLDYCRFSSDSKTAFQAVQIWEIRKTTTLPITHNYMGHYGEIDYYRYGKDLDVISFDNYINNMWGKSSYQSVAMAHDLTRGIKHKNFWIMEQQSGPCGWQKMGDTPEPGQLRLWTYQGIAHGAEAIVYFRWRACTVGIEQYWYGVLDHDGIPRRRYWEIKETGRELLALSSHIVDSHVKCDVALIKSYDNLWSHRGQPHNSQFDYNRLLCSYHTALLNNNINCEVMDISSDFTPYRLILMPAFNLVTPVIADKCKSYVENGGTLLLTFRSGCKNWDNSMTTDPLPGIFRDLAGLTITEFDSLNHGRTVAVEGHFGKGCASVWCDVLETAEAASLAKYKNHYYKDTPAITLNAYGKGLVYYIGCDLDACAMDALMAEISTSLSIQPAYMAKIPGLEAVAKEKYGKQYLYLLNHNNTSLTLPLSDNYTELISGCSIRDSLHLPPYEVAILLKEE